MTKYKLYFPVKFDRTHIEPLSEGGMEWMVGETRVQVKIEDTLCVFTVESIDTYDAAEDYRERIWAGIMWLMLNRSIPFRVNEPYYISPSTGGHLEPNRVIAHGTVSEKFETASPYIEFGLTLPNRIKNNLDDKLRLALELYNSHFYETSNNAKFITLIMVLETLIVDRDKSELAQALCKDWNSQTVDIMKTLDPKSEDYKSLEALQKELLFRKEASIRSRIVDLVESIEGPESDVLARQAKKLYDSRSTLVHKGMLPTDDLIKLVATAKDIAVKVLKVKFCAATGKEFVIR